MADYILEDIKHFNLAETLDCGQAFRWAKVETKDGVAYTGIAHGRRLELFHDGKNITIKNCTQHEFDTTWATYFDIGRDYADLRIQLSGDENLKNALAFSEGLRLIKQDPWETLISFIFSQNANIPRIKKMIAAFCESFGDKLPCGGFTFPAPEKIVSLNVSDLDHIKSGYRAGFILDAAQQVASKKVDIQRLESVPTEVVREALLGIKGVGPKVCDCVLLYGFGRVECYPVDVWIKRIMDELYPDGFPEMLLSQAGIAQLFLFQYVRNR